jgi:RNA polymerase sigma-70 factor (ECF subfamily)
VQDEQTLVRRAQEHEQEAFAELYERYFDKIYRYCVIKTGNRTEAEDMAQQVFLKAAKSISSFKWKNVPFSAWLYRIAHNQLVDHLRKKSRQQSLPLDEAVAVSDSNPQKTTELKMDIEEMIVATRGLTAAQREVISLRFAGELPIARVAEIMGKSQGAVKALQHSAIIALRKKMVGVVDNG